MTSSIDARVLRLNIAGQPIEWLGWQETVSLYARGLVIWSLGGDIKTAVGGRSRITGKVSLQAVPAIVACTGERVAPMRSCPPLTNRGLFLRDNNQCMYCAQRLSGGELTRDHVVPISRGGADRWENVVASCRRCNQKKAAFLLSEIDMPLVALPFRPNPYEYMALINSHRIRPDQMEYLEPQFQRYRCA